MTDRYTHGQDQSVVRSHASRTVDNSAAYLKEWLQPGTDVLDVGCGPGTITLDMHRLVAPGRVVGVENVAAPLEVARADARDRGHFEVEFVLGDAYSLGFPDGTFDVVHAHQVLQHLTEPVAALIEMRRACRPGGVVAARDVDYAAMTWCPQSAGISAWLELYRAVASGNGGQPDAGRRLLAWAQSAAFTDVRCSASVWCFAKPEELRRWGHGWADRILQSDFGRQALYQGLTTRPELNQMARAWRDWASSPDGWFSVLHGEIICPLP